MSESCPTCKRKMPPKGELRSIEQNARMWAMLGDVSAQVTWHGLKLEAEEWKDVFTAALKKQKVVPGIDGGFVVIGARTREMRVGELSELMELMEAFGAEQGVRFRAPRWAGMPGEVQRREAA